MSQNVARFIEGLAIAGMVDAAADRLARALRKTPLDPHLNALSGEIARTRGDLETAAEAFALAADGDPANERVTYLAAVTAGAIPATAPPSGEIWPAAFVRERDFLGPDRRAKLMRLALARMEDLAPATVRGGTGNETVAAVRSARSLSVLDELGDWFGPLLLERLADVTARLPVASFEHTGFELQLAHYGDGDFYAPHTDTASPDTRDEVTGRRIAFVYYFSKEPRPFTGGDLLLYDSDLASDRADVLRFTRVAPADNSIVFFPTRVLHEVTRVSCAGVDAADGRFTIGGWFHG